MASYLPGSYYGWDTWTSNTTSTITFWPEYIESPAPDPPKKKKPKPEKVEHADVSWLRGRVQEVCDESRLAA